MCVHVGHMFIHAKFHDPDGHRTVKKYGWKNQIRLKNPNFGFFERLLSIFWKKMIVKIQSGSQNFA